AMVTAAEGPIVRAAVAKYERERRVETEHERHEKQGRCYRRRVVLLHPRRHPLVPSLVLVDGSCVLISYLCNSSLGSADVVSTNRSHRRSALLPSCCFTAGAL
ncbi:hypothetical protein PIB30_096009, partial [Stylosanthes scabra]|nr:hypothetical protein [Stylosanthes scabra]